MPCTVALKVVPHTISTALCDNSTVPCDISTTPRVISTGTCVISTAITTAQSLMPSLLKFYHRFILLIVCPHLQYCTPVWTAHTKNLDHLENVQKRAGRWISSTTWDRTNHRWARSYDEDRSDHNLISVKSCHLFLS